MGDECTCEQCRGLGEAAPREWPVGVPEAARGFFPSGHECLLVVGRGGISIRLRPSATFARSARTAAAGLL